MIENKRLKNIIFSFLSIVFWVGVWHLLSLRIDKSLLLPSPKETLEVFIELAKTSDFWMITLSSVENIFLGIVAGTAIGIIISALSYISPVFRHLFSPLLSLVKSVPVASIIILMLVWIGKDFVPFAISVMMVTPIVSSNLYEGFINIRGDLKEVTKVYAIPFKKRWTLLYRHSIMPYLLSALKSALGLGWKAGIAAEVLCTPDNSIGLKLYESKIYMETPYVFAWTLTLVILSLILEKVVIHIGEILLGGKRK
ncbi:MAG: ABC transporter permease subunit [Ruminococcaceae bacterium]|nr:ABC transporter permease subunit [Oscillospiraceae bacterium]